MFEFFRRKCNDNLLNFVIEVNNLNFFIQRTPKAQKSLSSTTLSLVHYKRISVKIVERVDGRNFSCLHRKERLQLAQRILIGLQVVLRDAFLQGDNAAAYFGNVHQVVA